MKYTLKTMIVPVCLVIIVGTQIFDYFVNGDFNIIFIAMICFLTPQGIKGLNPEYGDSEEFKSLSKALLVIGIIVMSIALYISI